MEIYSIGGKSSKILRKLRFVDYLFWFGAHSGFWFCGMILGFGVNSGFWFFNTILGFGVQDLGVAALF